MALAQQLSACLGHVGAQLVRAESWECHVGREGLGALKQEIVQDRGWDLVRRQPEQLSLVPSQLLTFHLTTTGQ